MGFVIGDYWWFGTAGWPLVIMGVNEKELAIIGQRGFVIGGDRRLLLNAKECRAMHTWSIHTAQTQLKTHTSWHRT